LEPHTDGGAGIDLGFLASTPPADLAVDTTVDIAVDTAPPTRPLDPFETLFAAHFVPHSNAAKVAKLQPSALGIHCVGAALAIQRAQAGAAFAPAFVKSLKLALALTADRLVASAPSFSGGWGEGEPRDWFSDGTTNPTATADGYNTSYAAWCLSEAALAIDDPQRSATYRGLAASRLAAYRKSGFAKPTDAKQHCSDCGYFWYTPHKNDKGRYVKNINVLMGLASLVFDAHGHDAASELAGQQSVRSHSREIGADGDKNLNYLSRLDPKYDSAKQTLNTHNYIEAYAMLRAGELRHSATYVCRALRQYRKWTDKLASGAQQTQVAYASCHFARRDAAAFTRCKSWVASGHGLTNLGGVGLVADYWPEDARTAATMCP
jgi:hypothetical protein